MAASELGDCDVMMTGNLQQRVRRKGKKILDHREAAEEQKVMPGVPKSRKGGRRGGRENEK